MHDRMQRLFVTGYLSFVRSPSSSTLCPQGVSKNRADRSVCPTICIASPCISVARTLLFAHRKDGSGVFQRSPSPAEPSFLPVDRFGLLRTLYVVNDGSSHPLQSGCTGPGGLGQTEPSVTDCCWYLWNAEIDWPLCPLGAGTRRSGLLLMLVRTGSVADQRIMR